MLDMQFIRDNAEAVAENAKLRNMPVNVQVLLELDERYRNHLQIADALRAQRNDNAERLNKIQDKSSMEAQEIIALGKGLKTKLAEVEAELAEINSELTPAKLSVPNMTHPGVPVGSDDAGNGQIAQHSEPTRFEFEPKDHVALGQELDILDFDRGSAVAGAGFYFVKGAAALLEMALVNYAMEVCRSEGFSPMITPDLAYQEILEGTGYNPRGDETQIYSIEGTDLSLIATSEIALAGYYKDHTFAAGELDEPKRIVAVSHCFRTEAGSYGRESRGLYRVHQFTKVEMFIFCQPKDSDKMHDEILRVERKIMDGLELPYRVVDCCTGDLGGSAYRKYDIEAWMPFKNDWGEVTSTSNCTDFQARRLNTKYVTDSGKRELVHTLNGTAVVSSRVPLAIMENYQQADGSIKIPTVLHPYMQGVTEIKKEAK
ncbi:MAG: serine--tRNA ligase [Candidatus Kerfeldbacteria bacterium CG15_BIG_FIL_POST_REV_8_21_14_020_45_12]|uniref:Serine--tRNA ligase n=1 Tax=Candidatus Kerfeldbacteria bacterium CG15_BIG_FIL_POST_REV_8_21_14_020_45_12 TaxID=2014247 RepID=A0A2M7H4M9_9BACT|nr:MAG: serine--tRNA ligase [Candidatus Kerfeldbacteria bacterium CG15_BIG_FIL_POST_REV_8_21_14_020_45_12]PJA93015.1 MAG: serine--tRNA ligase [Candidatus Kerfeldbacteria bacterium CG_4_9_14_3_um_filter_45_8]